MCVFWSLRILSENFYKWELSLRVGLFFLFLFSYFYSKFNGGKICSDSVDSPITLLLKLIFCQRLKTFQHCYCPFFNVFFIKRIPSAAMQIPFQLYHYEYILIKNSSDKIWFLNASWKSKSNKSSFNSIDMSEISPVTRSNMIYDKKKKKKNETSDKLDI